MVDPDNEERLLKVPPRVVADIEARVREDERSNNFTPDDHSIGMTEAYERGLDAAREAVANTPMRTGAYNTKAADLAAIDALKEEQ